MQQKNIACFDLPISALYLKATKEITQKTLTVGDLVLNRETKTAQRKTLFIKLTLTEYFLLEYFMVNKNICLSASQILDAVWKDNLDTDSRVVHTYIGYLRTKIDKPFKKKLIHTSPRIGYMITDK